MLGRVHAKHRFALNRLFNLSSNICLRGRGKGRRTYRRVAGMKSDQFTPLLQSDTENHYSYTNSASPTRQRSMFPFASFSVAKTTESRRKPQCIAHRGYKARYPENTLCAFRAAIDEGGAHAIETDIHLTKDNVVVLSHDADLKRCFGRTEKVIDCDWEFISQLRTLKAPQEPMPRLQDLLEYMSQPKLQDKWIMLDIKIDNNADDVMRLIAKTLQSVGPGEVPWQKRVVLGIWAPKYLALCTEYLPGYPVTYIGFSTFLARQFLKVPNIGFNIFAKLLFGPIGNRFINEVKRAGRPLYLWTVNEPNIMKWGIAKGVDGVITDNPKLYNEVCKAFDVVNKPRDARVSVIQWFYTLWFYLMMVVYSRSINKRFGGSVDAFLQGEHQRLKAELNPGPEENLVIMKGLVIPKETDRD